MKHASFKLIHFLMYSSLILIFPPTSNGPRSILNLMKKERKACLFNVIERKAWGEPVDAKTLANVDFFQ